MKNQKLALKIRTIFWSKFTNSCHQAVIEGYKAMLRNPSKYKDWKEEKLSARLLHEMKQLKLRITIDREHYLEDEEILFGDKEAANAVRIDFIFSKRWFSAKDVIYFGEAKNLSLENWIKKSGKKVNAKQYRGRYIDTGIEKIISGAYSKVDAFLIAYVVNGNAKDNVVALNKLIQKRKIPPRIGLIDKQVPMSGYPECYISKNDKSGQIVELLHVFLEFDGSDVV